MDAAAAARAWADQWARAWAAHDVDAIVTLYADDVVFRSAPFREAHKGRAGVRGYVAWAFADEDAVDVRFGEPVVADGDRAAVEYWAVVTSAGREETLAGIAVLTFGADGRVTSQRDYWTTEPGRHAPPSGWGT